MPLNIEDGDGAVWHDASNLKTACQFLKLHLALYSPLGSVTLPRKTGLIGHTRGCVVLPISSDCRIDLGQYEAADTAEEPATVARPIALITMVLHSGRKAHKNYVKVVISRRTIADPKV